MPTTLNETFTASCVHPLTYMAPYIKYILLLIALIMATAWLLEKSDKPVQEDETKCEKEM